MRSSQSPSIRSRYDYYYSMSPSSTTAANNYFDNQNASLFGDPVPPSTDFLETLDSHLYGSFRRRNSNNSQSSAMDDRPMPSSRDKSSRFLHRDVSLSEEIVKPLPMRGKTARIFQREESLGEEIVKPLPIREMTTRIYQRDAFDMGDGSGGAANSSYVSTRRRSSSNFSDDIRPGIDYRNNNDLILSPIYSPSSPPKRIFPTQPLYMRRPSNESMETRRPSNDSNISNDWSNNNRSRPPTADDWSRIPRPVTALRKPTHTDPNVAPSSGLMSVIQSSASSTLSSEDEKPAIISRSRAPSAVQRIIPVQQHEFAEPSHLVTINPDDSENESHMSLQRELSPIIVRDTINTGSAYRAQSPKQHLKSSFTIINELKRQQSSRPASPPYPGRVSPFLGKGFKPHSRASSRTTSRATSPSQFDPQNFTDSLMSDPLRPTVQFNMSGPPDRGNMTPNQMPKGILQRRGIQYMSNQELSFNDPDMDVDEFERPMGKAHPRPRRTSTAPNMKTFQVLPQAENIQMVGDTKRRPVHRSAGELYKGSQSAGSRPAVNPTRYQRGMMRIVSSANNSPSRIPVLAGPSILQESKRPRRGSISPEKAITSQVAQARSPSPAEKQSFRVAVSIETGGNVSNKRPSRPGSRVVKPTTLSPIVGTPNKDDIADQDVLDDFTHTGVIQVNKSSVYTIHRPDLEDTYNTKRTKPSTGIPSRTASRASSRGSRLNSREPTPTTLKSTGKPQSKIPQKAERSSSQKRSISGSDARDSSIKRTASKKSSVPTSTSKFSSTKSKPADDGKSKKVVSSKSVKKTDSFKKAPASTKKEPPLKRELSNLKKTPSGSLKRETSNLKREPSNLKREPSNLKREPSNLKREPSNLKRTPSNLNKKDVVGVKREGSNMSILSKKASDQSLNGKKLEKKPSFNNKKDKNGNGKTEIDESKQSSGEMDADSLMENKTNGTPSKNGNGKDDQLVALTKAQVVSMTTAAIASQPVQITTTINNQLNKTNSSGTLNSQGTPAEMEKPASESDGAKSTTPTPAILEKTQKTLENIQKTVNEATDEIQKTLEENLTDLKSLQTEMTGAAADAVANAASHNPLEKKESSKSLKDKLANITEKDESMTDGAASTPSGDQKKTNNHLKVQADSDEAAERVSERAISVPPEVELESGNLQQKTDAAIEAATSAAAAAATTVATAATNNTKIDNNNKQNHNAADDRMKPNTAIENTDDIKPASPEPGSEPSNPSGRKGCCPSSKCSACCGPCCTRLCMPCRRLKTLNCFKRFRRDKTAQAEKAAAKMAEANAALPKESCWKRLNCCKRKKKDGSGTDEPMAKMKINETAEGAPSAVPQKPRGKCGLCLDKFFCCKRTNKIETMEKHAMDEMESNKSKCCRSSCFPCRRKAKPKEATAWTEQGEVEAQAQMEKLSCWQRVKNRLLCRKKQETRRTSMASKKQSLAPTLPPEDTRKKLDNVLVEHGSMMKGAIPVLPVCLAWFCLICNCLVPGLGTIISGLLCLCIGIPRFSQYDGARPRIGSLVINCIVGVAQAFCILFCLVGWGWSIWWGTIMLKTARKRKKIRDAEAYEVPSSTNASNVGPLQTAGTAAKPAAATAAPVAPVATAAAAANTDVEAGKT